MENEIANTTWNQISTQTKMACGARDPIADKSGKVVFKVGGPFKRFTRFIEVCLDPGSTYTVTYFRVKRNSDQRVDVESTSHVNNDMLSETIYDLVNK